MSNQPEQAPQLNTEENLYRLQALFFRDDTEKRPVVLNEVTEKRPVVKVLLPKEMKRPNDSFKQRAEQSASLRFNPIWIKRVKAQQEEEEALSLLFKPIRLQRFGSREPDEMGSGSGSQARESETINNGDL